MKKPPQSIKDKKLHARRRSIKEVIYASARSSFGERYLAPFAIAINSSSSLVAMLGSITGLLGPISQLFGSKLMNKHPRKKIITTSVFLESLIWIPLIIIAALFYKGALTNFLPIFLITFFALYTILANLGYPAYFSWTGDLVDKKFRGRWFSKRTLIFHFVTIIFAVSAAIFLDLFKENEFAIIGFIVLFILALFGRLKCYRIFKKQYYPKIKIKEQKSFSFKEFLKESPKTNFGKFALFRTSLAFATSISSPLLAVYLLRILGFDYTSYMAITLAGAVFMVLILNMWGKFSDKFGNYKIFIITTILIPLIPILWILFPSKIYLLLVPSIVGGIGWAGFNLAEKAFIYDSVDRQKRGKAISYYNMLSGIGIFLGAGVGAILIKVLTIKIIEPIILIFLIGALARMIAVFIWLPKIHEIRKTQKFKGMKDIENILLHESRAILTEEFHEIKAIKGYLEEPD
jgi:MFS family permease